MTKKDRSILVAALVLAATAIASTTVQISKIPPPRPPGSAAATPRDAAYGIEGRDVKFTDGAADGASMFGIPTEGDLDGDGDRDAVIMLTTDGGGSGTFFYLAAAVQEGTGYVGTVAVPVGDRIAPDTTSIEDGMIVLNYATRYPWEPFTAQASVGKTKRLRYSNGALTEMQDERLSAETAKGLAKKAWGDCASVGCTSFSAETLDGVDGVWYVQATYDGLADDSLKAGRKIASAHYANGTWVLGATLAEQQQCREGRGHQGFSSEPCN